MTRNVVADLTSADSFPPREAAKSWVLVATVALVLLSGRALPAQEESQALDDITAKYHFLSADDTLAILDEEGKLKGYIEVAQPESESDEVLNFEIVEGARTKTRVQFRTNRIHGIYYRFSGTVERGKGHEQKDPDYFRLVGDLDTVTVKTDAGSIEPGKPETTKETVQTTRVVFKSFGKSERPDE
jgi:hypothetical protein